MIARALLAAALACLSVAALAQTRIEASLRETPAGMRAVFEADAPAAGWIAVEATGFAPTLVAVSPAGETLRAEARGAGPVRRALLKLPAGGEWLIAVESDAAESRRFVLIAETAAIAERPPEDEARLLGSAGGAANGGFSGVIGGLGSRVTRPMARQSPPPIARPRTKASRSEEAAPPPAPYPPPPPVETEALFIEQAPETDQRPPSFPWPPPRPSARVVLDRAAIDAELGQARLLGSIADVLFYGLYAAGHYDAGFMSAPGGFAIVTRVEQIDENGSPLPEPDRWAAEIGAPPRRSWLDVLSALFEAPHGFYRIIVLVVTDKAAGSGPAPDEATARGWAADAFAFLPEEVRREELTDDHQVIALVYEFEKTADDQRPPPRVPGRLSAATHLAGTEIGRFVP
jgi:hypothetical protein